MKLQDLKPGHKYLTPSHGVVTYIGPHPDGAMCVVVLPNDTTARFNPGSLFMLSSTRYLNVYYDAKNDTFATSLYGSVQEAKAGAKTLSSLKPCILAMPLEIKKPC